MSDVILGERLTTFDISPDDDRFCLNFTDQSGSAAGLSLPSECLIQLIMTLPEMALKALKVRDWGNEVCALDGGIKLMGLAPNKEREPRSILRGPRSH